MKFKLFCIFAAAASIALIGIAGIHPASAADKTAKPAPAAALNWTGVYGGLNGGYGFGQNKSADIFEYTTFSGWTSPSSALPGTYSTRGGLAGGQIGANYQDGRMVFGVETDIDWSHIKGSYVDDPSASPADQSVISGTVEWFGTARARIGVTQDRFLGYATGGLAYGRVKGGVSNYSGAGSPYLTDRHTLVGWTVGGGLEYAISSKWSINAEYLYVDLGKKEFLISDPSNFYGYTDASAGYAVSKSNNSVDFNVVRIGINYKF